MIENDPKTPQRVIASTFKVSQSQISRIQNNREKLKKAWQNGNVNRKRNRKGKGGTIELKLLEWYNEAKQDGIPISGPTLMEKAKSIAKELNLEFTPTSGWFGRWKNRNGITLKVSKSNDPAMNFNKISVHWRRYTFTKLLREFYLENIWFLDSLWLLSKALPEDVSGSEVDALKKGKMFIIFAFNYFGSERKNPLIFGQESVSFDASPVNYYYGHTLKVSFAKWLANWDKELARERRKIGLVLSRTSYVPENLNLSCISVHFFPEGEASNLRLQPFHFGISATVKALYRYQIACRHLCSKAIHTAQEFSHPPFVEYSQKDSTTCGELLDVIYAIRRAWKHVHPDVFIRGVTKAGLSKHVQSLEIDADISPPPGVASEDFEKFVHLEDCLEAFDALSIAETETASSCHEASTTTDSEALFACNILRKYLQKQHKCALVESLAEIESEVQRQLLDNEEETVDPLFDSRSIHSLAKHNSSVIKQDSLKADTNTDRKEPPNNHPKNYVPDDLEALPDHSVKCLENYSNHQVVLPESQQNVVNSVLKVNNAHCNHVMTTLARQTVQPQQAINQYQAPASYIPQNLELKSITIGVPRNISDGIDRFTLHPDVQHGRPVNEMNPHPHIIPATQLTNQAPTFITFAPQF